MLPLFMMLVSATDCFSQNTVSDDRDWEKQTVVIRDAGEAELIIRIGDVDNLGFGWPDAFDPFCGRMTEVHAYPWQPAENDLPGFDRILMSSKFNPDNPQGCGGDGYSWSYDPEKSKPNAFQLPTEAMRGMNIKSAYLQIFMDDFQAPSFCSRFEVRLNGRRFSEAERIINAIDQTGPVGKLVSIPIPEEFFDTLRNATVMHLSIDEALGAQEGFAIDFLRLLVNRNRETTCKGNIRGKVLEKDTETPLQGVRLFLADQTSAMSQADGSFEFRQIYTGFEVVYAALSGYKDGSATADIGQGDDNPEVLIYLEKAREVMFDQQSIKVGQAVQLNNILFDQGKADLRQESKVELEKIVILMKENPTSEIELSGHTSSEGDPAFNRSLSYRRVKSCKDYIVEKGIDTARIIAVGYGPDRPIAPNDNEANRARNRRVEMRVVKL